MAENSDIHHKMSKKIAQLTKVIFHLNTKNDENSAYHQAQTDSYEKEIEHIIQEANGIIRKQKEALDKQKKAGDTQALMASIQNQYEESKNKAQTDLADLKRKMEAREAQLKFEAKEKVKTMKDDIVGLKMDFERQLKVFNGKDLASADFVEELKKAHQKELADYVQEHNAKYNTLLKAKMDMEDELNAALKKALDDAAREAARKLKEAVEAATAAEASRYEILMAKEQAEYEKNIKEQNTRIRDLESGTAQLEASLKDMQGQSAKLSGIITEWEKKYKKLEDEMQLLDSQRHMSGQEANQLGSELGDAQKEIKKLLDIVRDKDRIIANVNEEYNAMIETYKKEIEMLKSGSSEKEAYLHADLETKTQRIAALEHEVALLTQNLTEATEKLRVTENELFQVKADLEAMTEKFNTEREVREKENMDSFDKIEALQDEIVKLNENIESLKSGSSSEMSRLMQELDDLKVRMAKEKEDLEAELKSQHETNVNEIKQSHETDLEHKQSSHEFFVKSLKEEFTKQLNEQKATYEQRLAALEKQLANSTGESGEQIRALQVTVEELKTTIRQLESELSSRQATIDERDSQIAKNQAEIENLSSNISTLENDLLSQKLSGSDSENKLTQEIENLKREIEKITQTWQAKLDSTEAKYKVEIETLKQNNFKEIQALKDAHEQALADLRAEFEANKGSIVQELEAEIAKLKGEIESLKKAYEDKIAKLQEEKEAARKEVEKFYADKMAKVEATHKAEMDAAREKWNAELEAARNNLGQDKESALKALEEKKQKEIDALNASHENMLQKLSNDFDANLAKKQADFDKQIEDLKMQIEIKNKEMADNAAAHANALEAELVNIKKLKHEIALLKQEVEKRNTQAAYLETRIKEYDQKLRDSDAANKEAIAQLKMEFVEKESNLKLIFKQEKEILLKEHLEETAKLQEEFNTTTELMEERYNDLLLRFEELSELHEQRPSRDEDLKLIKHLQEQVGVKEEALKKAYEDMKFYKLELINREENYNKVFGAAPNVGVLNPLANSKRPPKTETRTMPPNSSSQFSLGGTNRVNSQMNKKQSRP